MTQVPHLLIDTNVIVRFVIGDHEEFKKKSDLLFAGAEAGKHLLVVPYVVIIESLHVLTKIYKVEKKVAAGTLLKMLNSRSVKARAPSWLKSALFEYLERPVSFADACIAAEARELELPVVSFDSDFNLLPDVKRYEPK